MIYLYIYLLGCLIASGVCLYAIRDEGEFLTNDIVPCLLVIAMSWVGVIGGLFCVLDIWSDGVIWTRNDDE